MGAALLLGQRESEKVAGMQTGSGSHQGKAKTEAGSGVAPERTVFPGSPWEGRWPVAHCQWVQQETGGQKEPWAVMPRRESLSIAWQLYWEGGSRADELGCSLRLGQL